MRDHLPRQEPEAAGRLISFRAAQPADLAGIAELEMECFPPDEAESSEVMAWRIAEAPGLFFVAVQNGGVANNIIGFICGTLTTSSRLSKMCMEKHEPNGGVACIHSVCIASTARGQGLATRMLSEYLKFVQQTTPQLTEIRLLTKQHLLPWYASLGFQVVGPSEVVHGRDRWTEMVFKLCAAEETSL